MDAERFDRFARELSGRLTRRRFPALGAAASLLWSPLAADSLNDVAEAKKTKKKKKNKKKKKSKRPAPCTVISSDTATTTDLTVKFKDLTLTSSDRIPNDASGGFASTTIVRQKKALLLQMTASYQPGGLTQIEILYGPAYKGIQKANLTTDGTTVSGTVDGRAIVPFPVSGQPDSLQFQDGQPAPQMSLNAKLDRQITQLYTRAAAAAETCTSGAARATRPSARRHDSLECLSCLGACAAGMTICAIEAKGPCAAAAALCLFGAPACFAVCYTGAFALCGLAAVGCVDICARVPCCAIACHHANGDNFCCEEGQTCLRPGTCCRAGDTPCGGQVCCQPGDRCMPDGTCCPGSRACGANCCGAFTPCCGGQCCSGSCNGNVCCQVGTSQCGSGCCADGNACCNGDCCDPGEGCINNVCTAVCTPDQEYCAPINQCCNQSCCFRFGSWGCGPSGCVS